MHDGSISLEQDSTEQTPRTVTTPRDKPHPYLKATSKEKRRTITSINKPI